MLISCLCLYISCYIYGSCTWIVMDLQNLSFMSSKSYFLWLLHSKFFFSCLCKLIKHTIFTVEIHNTIFLTSENTSQFILSSTRRASWFSVVVRSKLRSHCLKSSMSGSWGDQILAGISWNKYSAICGDFKRLWDVNPFINKEWKPIFIIN